MSHKEHTATHICSHVTLSLSPSLNYRYFSWGRLTHLWDSQQFVALGTPWKNRCVCWSAANTVLLSVRAGCVCAFAFSCWTLRDLASRLRAAALCASSAACRREVSCYWTPTHDKRMQRNVMHLIGNIDTNSFALSRLSLCRLPVRDEVIVLCR